MPFLTAPIFSSGYGNVSLLFSECNSSHLTDRLDFRWHGRRKWETPHIGQFQPTRPNKKRLHHSRVTSICASRPSSGPSLLLNRPFSNLTAAPAFILRPSSAIHTVMKSSILFLCALFVSTGASAEHGTGRKARRVADNGVKFRWELLREPYRFFYSSSAFRSSEFTKAAKAYIVEHAVRWNRIINPSLPIK